MIRKIQIRWPFNDVILDFSACALWQTIVYRNPLVKWCWTDRTHLLHYIFAVGSCVIFLPSSHEWTLYAMMRAMETHRVLFHLRIIYILLFILSAFSIAALWVSLEAYSGLKRLDKVKWRMFRYPSYRNITEDEMQRAKRNHVEPPDMFQDVTFAGLSSSGIDLYPMVNLHFFFLRIKNTVCLFDYL